MVSRCSCTLQQGPLICWECDLPHCVFRNSTSRLWSTMEWRSTARACCTPTSWGARFKRSIQRARFKRSIQSARFKELDSKSSIQALTGLTKLHLELSHQEREGATEWVSGGFWPDEADKFLACIINVPSLRCQAPAL